MVLTASFATVGTHLEPVSGGCNAAACDTLCRRVLVSPLRDWLPRTAELSLHGLLKLCSGCERVGIAVCHRMLSGPPRTGELQDLQFLLAGMRSVPRLARLLRDRTAVHMGGFIMQRLR